MEVTRFIHHTLLFGYPWVFTARNSSCEKVMFSEGCIPACNGAGCVYPSMQLGRGSSVKKIFVLTVKGFTPATSSARDQDATTAPVRHMWETGSLNWLRFILQWFITCPEILFHLGKIPLFQAILLLFGIFHKIRSGTPQLTVMARTACHVKDNDMDWDTRVTKRNTFPI